MASMYLINFGIKKIYIGSVQTDSQFKDGTDRFTVLISRLTSFQEGGIEVEAPAIHMNTDELIKESKIPLSILLCAHSCHSGNLACGKCRGCNKYLSVVDKFNLVTAT